jgi:hypothetical protein
MEGHSAAAPAHDYQQQQTQQHAHVNRQQQQQQHQHEGIYNNGGHVARGRQARDPQAKTVPYSVASMDEFETSLREYLTSPPDEPEHTECQLSFWIGATFLVTVTPTPGAPAPPPQQQQQHPDAPPGFQPANAIQHYGQAHAYADVSDPQIALSLASFQPSNAPEPQPQPSANGAESSNPIVNTKNGKKPEPPKVTMGILDALQNTPDPKEKMRKQRAIAKCCVDSIQKIDGYRYSFHNCWNSREDDAFRFSYYCNDSLLNKDRAANGKGAKLGKRATKPVFDCKGVLSVKFSASKQTLDVYYKHVPMHKTYEERAPAPRRDSKRRKTLADTDPDALDRIQSRPKPPSKRASGSDGNSPSGSRAKRKSENFTSSTSLESDLRAESLVSLLDLIRRDPAPESPNSPLPSPMPFASVNRPLPQQTQAPQQHSRKRPRNSCDVCKRKKTKVRIMSLQRLRPVLTFSVRWHAACMSDLHRQEQRVRLLPRRPEALKWRSRRLYTPC